MKIVFGILTVFTIFCQQSLCADSFLGQCVDSHLDVEYSYNQKAWIMGLSDGSSWKLFPLSEKRKQSWTEWWGGTEPKEWSLSEEYFFDPYNWKGTYAIAVYEANDALNSSCKHILVNQTTNQKVFAEFIPYGSQLIPKLEYAMKVTENSDWIKTNVLDSYHFTDDFLILENNSVWKLHLIDQNSQTWSEWWQGTEIDQPDEMFISSIKDWKNNDRIRIHQAELDNLDIHQKYKVVKPLRKIFFLENKSRGKAAYASSVSLKDFIEISQEEAEKKIKSAYSQGHSDGYWSGHRDGKQQSYQDGYQQGYRDGQKIHHVDGMD